MEYQTEDEVEIEAAEKERPCFNCPYFNPDKDVCIKEFCYTWW
jgi:hypothetical protein